MDKYREMAEQSLFEESFEELEGESYECYNCGWSGEDFFSQEANLWDTNESMFLCPECGEMIC